MKSSGSRLLVIYLLVGQAISFVVYEGLTGHVWALFQEWWTAKPDNLRLSAQKLESSERPPEYPQIEKLHWLDNETIQVSFVIGANYGAVRWCGDYGLTNHILTLRYKTILTEFQAAGWRPVRLTYLIRGIPRDEYVVRVKESGQVVRDW